MDWFLYDKGLRHERVRSTSLDVVTLRQYLVLAFTVGFWKDYRVCFLLLVTLSAFIDTLLHSCQLEGSFYDYL